MSDEERELDDEPAASEPEKHGLLERAKEWLEKPPAREYGASREEDTDSPTVIPPPD
jgi:hypothetical protein